MKCEADQTGSTDSLPILRALLIAACSGGVIGGLGAAATFGAWAWAAELGRTDANCYWCAPAPYWALLTAIAGVVCALIAIARTGFQVPATRIPTIGAAAVAIAVSSGAVAWSLAREGLLVGWRDLTLADSLTVSNVDRALASAYQALAAGESSAKACQRARQSITDATDPAGIQTMLGAHLIMGRLVEEVAREEMGQTVCVDRQEAESQLAQLERVWRREVQVARWSVGGWASPSNPFGAEAFAYGVMTANYNATHGDLGVARNAGMDPSALLALETELHRRFIKLEAARDRYMALGTPQDDIGRPGSKAQPR